MAAPVCTNLIYAEIFYLKGYTAGCYANHTYRASQRANEE